MLDDELESSRLEPFSGRTFSRRASSKKPEVEPLRTDSIMDCEAFDFVDEPTASQCRRRPRTSALAERATIPGLPGDQSPNQRPRGELLPGSQAPLPPQLASQLAHAAQGAAGAANPAGLDSVSHELTSDDGSEVSRTF